MKLHEVKWGVKKKYEVTQLKTHESHMKSVKVP